jgi:uncharacterized protein
MTCCGHNPEGNPDLSEVKPAPLPPAPDCCQSTQQIDWIFWVSLFVVILGLCHHFLAPNLFTPSVGKFSSSISQQLQLMWWGVLLGIFAISVMNQIPRTWVMSLLGGDESRTKLLRAVGAGLLLDLCNHGILMVAAKLYERGASYAQVVAFLVASPWNSFSLTLILISLLGFKWTIIYIVLSAIVALIAGLLVETLTRRHILAANPNRFALPTDFSLRTEISTVWRTTTWTPSMLFNALRQGVWESQMIIRCLLFGMILSGLIQTFISDSVFGHYFGPTLLGLALTLVAATVIEVCSEGSVPIATDLFTRAAAPGNAFTFLMAGAATDYTEIMILRQATGSWKMALILPLVTVPQILVLGWVLNQNFF